MPLSSVVGASSILKPGVCTSSTRPAAPFEGQTIYETDTDRLLSYDGSAWIAYVKQTAGKILQVVQTVKTDAFSTASTSFVDVTGMSVTITPSATSSKVLVICSAMFGITSTSTLFKVVGGNMASYLGDTAGNRTPTNMAVSVSTQAGFQSSTLTYLDSPATTSATTYKLQVCNRGAEQTTVNRSFTDTDNNTFARGASSIIVCEVSA